MIYQCPHGHELTEDQVKKLVGAFMTEQRAKAGKERAGRPPTLRKCKRCGVMLGARAMRAHKCNTQEEAHGE